MNFETLNMLANSIKDDFKCQFCSSKVTTQNLFLVASDGVNVVFDVKCPKCGKSNPVHSKAISIDLTNSPMKKEFEVVKNMINAKNAIKTKKKGLQINDTLITDLSQNLKKKQMNATDLFSEN